MGEIIMYGERGVVNAIVRYLMCSADSLKRCQEFFSSIRWVDDVMQDWISNLQKVDVIIEVGLGEFGDPDLVFICEGTNGEKRFVFLEAKIDPYGKSAISNSVGMKHSKFNSSINGQLSLKYRFVQALREWKGISNKIVEPVELYAQYKKHLHDTKKSSRQLSKSSILSNILNTVGLSQVDLNNCFFVALTNDKEPGPLDSAKKEFLPLLLDESGNDIWETWKSQFGWIGYDCLSDNLKMDECYRKTLENTDVVISGTAFTGEMTCPNIIPKTKLKDISSEPLKTGTLKLFNSCIEIFDKDKCIESEGSYSIKFGKKVFVKLVPKEDEKKGICDLYVGLSTQLELENYDFLPIVKEFKDCFTVMGQPFYGLKIPDNLIEKRIPQLKELFENLP